MADDFESTALLQSILNSIEIGLKSPDTYKIIPKNNTEATNKLTHFLEKDINLVQKVIDRKRLLNFGNDILKYIINPGLTEPEYCVPHEKQIAAFSVLVEKYKQKTLTKHRKQAQKVHEFDKQLIETRREQFWCPEIVNDQKVIAEKGYKILIEPLNLARERIRKDREEEQKLKEEWESKVAKVKPYLDEVKHYGEPRHRVNSQFWFNLLGAEICNEHINLLDKLRTKNDAVGGKDMERDDVESSTKELQKNERDLQCKKEQHKKARSKLNEKEKLQVKVAQQRERELNLIKQRKDKQWHPTKANKRRILRDRYNNPPKAIPEKIIKPPPRVLTDLERKQLQARIRHEYEMEKMKLRREKAYSPGKFNDTSNIKITDLRSQVSDDCEDKEYELLVARFLNKRQKQLLEHFKWRNIVYPRPTTSGPGVKIFTGFTPIQQEVICNEVNRFHAQLMCNQLQS